MGGGTETDFVHLRCHSRYSLLTSPLGIDEAVAAAMADGQSALALTDDGNLFGAIEFYKACRAAGVRPILGMSAFVASRSRLSPTAADNNTTQLTLLATDARGWSNLMRLASLGYLEGFHYRPRIDRELLARHHEGLVVLTGSSYGEIPQHLLAGRDAEARRIAAELREVFGKERLYLEVMEIAYEPQTRINAGLYQLAAELDLPVVATNDVHYLTAQDWIVQDILLCIRNGQVVSNPQRFRMGSRDLWFKPRAVMADAFRDRPDAVRSTVEIAERCHVDIDFDSYHLPVFDTGSEETPAAMFRRLCHEGARARYGDIGDTVRERLHYEIEVIEKLGLVSYFLITQDFIRHARARGIPVGPGRGSAAGSMVAYAMGITNLDPLRYNLIFERFLNAARVSMPDIDIDFCGDRRDEVIGYVRDKYGAANVSQIITFGTMASRGVLRDVGRVLEVPLSEVDRIAKKVPSGPGASLAAAVESDKELAAIRAESEANRRLFDLGIKLEGLPRHSSIHAAGVVIADRPLIDYVPLAKNGDDVTTQWQMTELEEVGLLKVDFLGLKTLTILHEATRLISASRGEAIDLDSLPLDDADTFALMTRGETLGVFQLESGGMRDLLARLQPDTFEDVVAVLALYRPGPLGSGMVDMFVRRKHGQEEVRYPHDDLRPILEETYGVIVYQEQVMRIANVLAGFSMNDADNLRKAMGKKKPEVMARFKEQFVTGAVTGGHDRRFARELFETIEYFAGYGFNKSHSAAYALLTYQTAWLKAHYPLEFFAANLTVESGNSDKVKEFVDAARRSNIEIRPPDVSRSERWFAVEDDAVRFGLGAIKGVGSKAADTIADERRDNGPYRDLDDLCERHDGSVLNKTVLEALVKAGALDGMHGGPECRARVHAQVDTALRSSARTREDRRRGQGLLFSGADAEPPPPPATDGAEAEWPELERLAHEKAALGFYFSGHPFEKRGAFLSRLAGHSSSSVREALAAGMPVDKLRVAGMISSVRVLVIKSGRNAGQKMARFVLEDLHGSLPVTCFARAYQACSRAVVEDELVIVTASLDPQSEEPALLAESVEPAQAVVNAEVDGIVARLSESWQLSERILDRIAAIAERHRGSQKLQIEVEEAGRVLRVCADGRFGVHVTHELIDELAEAIGPEAIGFTRA